jgi:hypothetical protein
MTDSPSDPPMTGTEAEHLLGAPEGRGRSGDGTRFTAFTRRAVDSRLLPSNGAVADWLRAGQRPRLRRRVANLVARVLFSVRW